MRRATICDASAAAICLLLLIFAPAIMPGNYYLPILTSGLIYGIWAASWDFMSGLTGRMNFGQGLSFGVAAYVAAYSNVNYGLGAATLFPMGVGIAVLLAIAVGYPTLRLRGPYFGLATFAALIVTQRVVLNLWEITGAEEGISGIDALVSGQVHLYYVVAVIAVLCIGLLFGLSRSRIGVILRAIKGNEATCQAAGINVTFYKILSLCISSATGAIGGVSYAFVQQHVGPDLLSMQLALSIVTMAYIGGVGTIYGGAIAAIILTFMVELLRPFGEWRLAAYAMLLIASLFMAPKGLIAPVWQWLRCRLVEREDPALFQTSRDAA